MATLKDHQQAMVDLLASGSGIPASASRLAHAMHDVLSAMLGDKKESFAEEMTRLCNERIEATTPGLNDKALAADVEACRVKLTGAGGGPKADLFDRAVAAERRVKEMENTVKQLRASNAKLRLELVMRRVYAEHYAPPEQAGCRKDDTQVCEHSWNYNQEARRCWCGKCGATRAMEDDE